MRLRPSRIACLKWLLLSPLLLSLILLYNFKPWTEHEQPGQEHHYQKLTLTSPSAGSAAADQLNPLRSINWTQLSASNDSDAKFNALHLISTIFQDQLTQLQQQDDCNQRFTLKCGHNDFGLYCGFACQVHQRIACLMTAQSLKMPLIHDEIQGWPFSQKWSDVFKPLGSDCQPGPNTFTVKWIWMDKNPVISRKSCWNCSEETIDHPLADGLPAPADLADLVELVHPRPWLWWIGQFMKYGLQLREDVRQRVDADKERIGLPDRPLVGVHIRRTDKISEADWMKFKIHPLEQYFNETSRIYDQNPVQSESRSVFIASEDHLVLAEAKEKYGPPAWKVFAFPANVTHHSMEERRNDLYSVVRDLIVLAEDCEFVVCGFSSNICRLLLEMSTLRFLDPWVHIKSLDGNYAYIYMAKSIPEIVRKV